MARVRTRRATTTTAGAAGRPAGSSALESAGLRRIDQPTVVEELVRGLRAMIMAGEVRPGERIVEDRLGARFGVSRPPIREAMRLLEHEGLVRRLPRRGVIVTPLTHDDVREIYSLRLALERLALELIVPVDDPRLLDPLRAIVEAMREASAAGDRERLLDANVDFHITLCELSGHGRLIATYRSLLQQLRLCMAINLGLRDAETHDLGDAARRHAELLELIEAGDVAAAVAGLESHGAKTVLERPDAFAAPGSAPAEG